MDNGSILILGNGPSMKKEYFENIKELNIPSIGMNSAYRFYQRINWWPTYYVGFDSKVTASHRDSFIKMIKNHSNNIKEFLFYKENFPEKEFEDYERLRLCGFPPRFQNQSYHHITTGTCAVRYAISMGYKNIYLFGINSQYVEKVAERSLEPNTTATFKLLETPKNNPNYFFEDYQLKNDVYNIPNSPFHLNAWRELALHKQMYSVNIYQTNKDFPLKEYPYISPEEIYEKFKK